jgi:carboxymethylenebutenolidase
MSEWVSVPGPAGAFEMYVAAPQNACGPAVIVAHEIYGPTEYMRSVCDELASYGCYAGCANLFWRARENYELGHDYDSWREATRLEDQIDQAAGYLDLAAALNFLVAIPGCTGKRGIVGHCMGGLYAYLFAARAAVDCAVAYYPVGIDGHFREAGLVERPLMIHMPENDVVVGREGQERLRQVMSHSRKIHFYHYAGTGHGFARTGGRGYHPMAAEIADLRTKTFFRRYLF